MPEVLRKLRRISRMPGGEIAHRVREMGSVELERLGVAPAIPSIDLRKAANRFYTGIREVAITPASGGWQEALNDAERILRHEFQLLGLKTITLDPQIDWHKDPYSGKRWEVKFWADYKPVDDAAGRDPKVTCELNRHQHLPRLAAAYILTRDERYATEALAQIHSWIDQNPVGRGFNWHSSLELAIRAVSWLWTILPIRESAAFTEGVAAKITKSLVAQLQHVARHLSTFSSPNTHLIGEATTLYIAGIVFEHEPWATVGGSILNAELRKQTLDGAVYGELSSWYHCYTIDFYLQSAILGRQNQRALLPATEAALESMLDYLMHLTRPDGTIPLLGDDDGGKAFPLGTYGYHSYSEALAIGAVLFQRPDFKHAAKEFPASARWLLGRQGFDTWCRLESRAPQTLAVSYPRAGYAVQRSRWHPDATHMVFDTGGMGILTGGHAHADALSITLHSNGREILIDPATFVYNCKPEWRAYFRSTAAHNTATVDGQSQVSAAGPFAWKTRMNTRCSSALLPTHRASVRWHEGEHDGYRSLDVTHRRCMMQTPGGYWLVLDRFAGSGPHRYDLHYHFNPATEPQCTGSQVHAQEFLLAMHATAELTCAMHIGETQPISGWASNCYGELHPIPSFRATMSQDLSKASAGAITFLVPEGAVPRIGCLDVDAGQGIACSLDRDGFTDLILFAPDSGYLKAGALRCQGEFFWLRTEGGVVQDAFSVRATHFEYEGMNLLEEKLCAPSAAF